MAPTVATPPLLAASRASALDASQSNAPPLVSGPASGKGSTLQLPTKRAARGGFYDATTPVTSAKQRMVSLPRDPALSVALLQAHVLRLCSLSVGSVCTLHADS